jgi:hypothetical protein
MTKGQKYKQEWTKRYTENLRLSKAAVLYFTVLSVLLEKQNIVTLYYSICGVLRLYFTTHTLRYIDSGISNINLYYSFLLTYNATIYNNYDFWSLFYVRLFQC